MIGPFAAWRRSLYRSGVLRREALPRPVISVGNLTVGGSAKTPHVKFLASWLSSLGIKVAVLSRGYGRESRGVVWVSHGAGPVVSASVGGDEPVLLAGSLPGVPVLVGESRAEAGREALSRRDVDAFLLDDGFQHLALRRDADLLLLDAGRGLGNGRTLPLGPLREPPESARDADAIVITRSADDARGEALAAAVRFPPDRPRARSRLVPRALVDRHGAESALPPPGQEVAAFCGLARNEQFAASLREAGFVVRRFLGFRDHHPYGPADIDAIESAAEGLPVVTTEKDLVRLAGAVPFRLAALRVEVEFLSGWDALSRLILERVESFGKK